MADRRLPYARTLAVLCILAWPYQYPPLSWLSRGIDWLSATPARVVATVMTCTAFVAWTAVVWWVTFHG
ncbi:hypothetical protein AB0B63_07165 [Micromonospora sp. NPDC049081]|uniref:hypothetical protein n=1 Tax=Micromonospora sp. NPDC049081 TaxID=3155150 RepID=UPI0033EF677B